MAEQAAGRAAGEAEPAGKDFPCRPEDHCITMVSFLKGLCLTAFMGIFLRIVNNECEGF